MDIDYRLIGKRIRKVRTACGLTQEEVADICNVSSKYISMIENGKKKASLSTLISLSMALSVSLDSLVFGGRLPPLSGMEGFAPILVDLNFYEQRVLMDLIRAAKESLRLNQFLRP